MRTTKLIRGLNISCRVETEEILKVTGSQVHCKVVIFLKRCKIKNVYCRPLIGS